MGAAKQAARHFRCSEYRLRALPVSIWDLHLAAVVQVYVYPVSCSSMPNPSSRLVQSSLRHCSTTLQGGRSLCTRPTLCCASDAAYSVDSLQRFCNLTSLEIVPKDRLCAAFIPSDIQQLGCLLHLKKMVSKTGLDRHVQWSARRGKLFISLWCAKPRGYMFCVHLQILLPMQTMQIQAFLVLCGEQASQPSCTMQLSCMTKKLKLNTNCEELSTITWSAQNCRYNVVCTKSAGRVISTWWTRTTVSPCRGLWAL